MSQASRMSQSRAYTEGFCDSLVGQKSQSRKRLRNFSKIWVFKFLATLFSDSECFVSPFATSSRVDLPNAKNTWKSFSNFCVMGFGDLLATYFSRENHVFCALRTFFKNFFNFLSFTLTVHCLVHSSCFHKLTMFLTKNLHFPYHLYFNLQEKVWVFYLSQSI